MQDKTVLITAAGQGIGRACAERFLAAGARVLASDLDARLLDGLAAEGHALDVRDGAAVEALVAGLGPVDVLVNCAGVVHGGTILDQTEAELDLALDINLRGTIRTIRAVLPGMLAAGSGSIVNIASVVSSLKGAPDRCVYGTSKAAVIGLTKSVAADFVSRGIRCNAICPGTVESPSLRERLGATGDAEAARAAFVARQPMGRLGTPEEIADLALWLACSGYTTGQAIAIDGGWTI
ncbi:short-chain dehydrogenase/reductase SDR (plasmid) [Cereibacter sphaeroides WS8N]|uniref:SDR family oxidoreductase n=1 Tax=Cereibacter sphaeroides TaxID=1063 RepID=UPI00020B01CE|nr:SDR family oxidoreductase [Cereibacter sphaeroides]EGJ19458.1 short-chain dehydrogenase/reductase SDR [Cereibacter sphaeroides WS8N]